MASSPYSPRAWSPSLLSNYRTLLFDCDGVLWHESSVVEGAIATLKALEAQVSWSRTGHRATVVCTAEQSVCVAHPLCRVVSCGVLAARSLIGPPSAVRH